MFLRLLLATSALGFYANTTYSEFDRLLHEAGLTDKRRLPGGLAAGITALGAVFASVKEVSKGINGEDPIKPVAGLVGSIENLMSKTTTNRFVAIEIKNKYDKHIVLSHKGTWNKFGYNTKACDAEISPATKGACGISKGQISTTGVYGVAVYRANHGAPFVTHQGDYWVDFAILYGNPQRFAGPANWFGLYVGKYDEELKAGPELYDKMYEQYGAKQVGVRQRASAGKPIVMKKSGLKVVVSMNDDWKPVVRVSVGPDGKLFADNEDSWGALANFFARDCMRQSSGSGMAWDPECSTQWLHKKKGFKEGGYTWEAAQEVCLADNDCKALYWSTDKAIASTPLKKIERLQLKAEGDLEEEITTTDLSVAIPDSGPNDELLIDVNEFKYMTDPTYKCPHGGIPDPGKPYADGYHCRIEDGKTCPPAITASSSCWKFANPKDPTGNDIWLYYSQPKKKTPRGWGIMFMGGQECDLESCSVTKAPCGKYKRAPFNSPTAKMYKCRLTPSSYKGNANGR